MLSLCDFPGTFYFVISVIWRSFAKISNFRGYGFFSNCFILFVLFSVVFISGLNLISV